MTTGFHSLKVAVFGIRHKNFGENLLPKKNCKTWTIAKKVEMLGAAITSLIEKELVEY